MGVNDSGPTQAPFSGPNVDDVAAFRDAIRRAEEAASPPPPRIDTRPVLFNAVNGNRVPNPRYLQPYEPVVKYEEKP